MTSGGWPEEDATVIEYGMRRFRRNRHWANALDSTGFWWIRGRETALVRWDSLAGVGIYWARSGRRLVCTVELCPREEIDRDDPLLWPYVRDADPLRPGLPEVRYRIDVRDLHEAYEEALRQWAPDLWFGREEQPASYAGDPDRAGHRRRLLEDAGVRDAVD